MLLKLNQQSGSVLLIVLKLMVLTVIGYLLYEKLNDQEDIIKNIRLQIGQSVSKEYLLYLLVCLLMFINWSVEALKWKLLAAKVKEITFWESLTGVLSGLTLSFATPHGVGDYFGRILSINSSQREKLVGSLFIGRTSQMLATVLFGMVGLSFLYGWIWVVALLIITYASLALCFQLATWFNGMQRVKRYVTIIFEYSKQELTLVQLLAMARYIVFASQFLIVLHIYLPSLSISLAFAGTSYIFLAKSIFPTFNFLSDLGVREYSAIYFFESYQIEIVPILCASLSIWLINILIPTILGIPGMLQLKWQRS